jgi:hypothetical protein
MIVDSVNSVGLRFIAMSTSILRGAARFVLFHHRRHQETAIKFSPISMEGYASVPSIDHHSCAIVEFNDLIKISLFLQRT